MEKDYIIQFEGLLSFAEAAAIWGKDPSSLRKAAADGRLRVGEDCQKFGKQWVVTVDAMAREFSRHGHLPDYAPWIRHLRAQENQQAAKKTPWEFPED